VDLSFTFFLYEVQLISTSENQLKENKLLKKKQNKTNSTVRNLAMNYLAEHCRNQVVPKLDNAIQCKKTLCISVMYSDLSSFELQGPFRYFYEDFLNARNNF